MAQYRLPHLHWMIPAVCAVILGFSLYGYLTQRESALAVQARSSSGNVAQQAESASAAETNKPIVYNTFAIRNELWSNLVYDEFIRRRPDLSFHSL